ncbi:MAG: proprotein convertase P-domain-containing protein, partial [Thermoanaerobaculia bacterium]|nr:proprotein convertase P-domain-containing protein [Thermoanaerobaculia bacterium]
ENVGPADIAGSCGAPTVRTFDVNSHLTIHTATLGLDVYAVYRNRLRARLVSPQGAEIELLGGLGGENITFDVLLDSRSSNPLDDGDHDNYNEPFFDRVARPITNLAAFRDEDAYGTWKLMIYCVSGCSGVFHRARLEVSSADLFADGFESSDLTAWSEWYF